VLHAVFEPAAGGRGVEDDEAHVAPEVGLVLAADDADGPLERLAGDPQLAIERRRGQFVGEPVGRVEQVAQAREELFAVPVGPHAVKLLAHPPPGQVGRVVPRVGQQQRRAGVALLVAVRRRLRGPLRQRAAEAGLLGRVAAQLAEVLAGAALDGGGLVAPGRAGAGVDAAHVLEHVGLDAGALHFDLLAVLQVGHGWAPRKRGARGTGRSHARPWPPRRSDPG